MRKPVRLSVLLILCLPFWLPAALVPPAEAWTNARESLFPAAYRLPAGAPDRMAAELLVAEWFLPEARMVELLAALPGAEAALARTWRAVFASRRWGVYAALERLAAAERALLGEPTVRWLQGYGSFAEEGAFPGGAGLRAYLRGAFLMRDGSYADAAAAFLDAVSGLDAAEPRQRLLAATAAGFADFCRRKSGGTPPPGFVFRAGEPARLVGLLFTNAAARAEAAAALPARLASWARAIAAAPAVAGRFEFSDVGEMHFAEAGTNRAALLRLGGRDLLGADAARLCWFLDGGVFRTVGTFSRHQPAPHWLSYTVDFNVHEDGAGLQFNFSILDEPLTRIDWRGLLLLAGKGAILVSPSTAGHELIWLRPLAPFSSTRILVVEKNGLPETIELGEWGSTAAIAFRGLDFSAGADAGLRRRLAAAMQEAVAVTLPLSRQLLDNLLLALTYARRPPLADPGEDAEERRLAEALYRDLQGERRGTAQYATLAEKYASLGERRPTFLPAAAWFSVQAFRFEQAIVLLEAWFRDGGNEGDGRLRMQYGPLADPDSLYAEALLNHGAYAKAGAFFRNRLRTAVSAGEAGRVAGLELALADLAVRAGDWQAATRQLAETNTNAGLRAAVAAVGGFLAPPAPGRLRLPFIPTLPGRGRNHCVPVAAEFVLRFYKDAGATPALIAEALGTGDGGTGFHRMTGFFRARGYALHALRADEAVLRDCLARGVPVLVFLHVPRRLIGHVAVVVGIDPDGAVYLYEPGERFAVARHDRAAFAALGARSGALCFAVGRDPAALPAADPAAAAAAEYYDSVSSSQADTPAAAARLLRGQAALLAQLAAADRTGAWSGFLLLQRLDRSALLLGLGNLVDKGEREAAAALLDAAPPALEDGETLRARGGLAQALGRDAAARAAWEHALARDPADVLTARLLLQADLAAQRWTEAEARARMILAAVDLYPELEGLAPAVLNQLAMLRLLALKDPRGALEALLALPESLPDDGPLWRRIRELLVSLGEAGTLRFLGQAAALR